MHRPDDERKVDGGVLEYKSLFGFYWCFEDRLFELDLSRLVVFLILLELRAEFVFVPVDQLNVLG